MARARSSDEAFAPEAEDSDFELTGYCGRPSCRRPFAQTGGRGRRREFCSDLCRRGADRDYKRARAMVAHFEELLERSRHDVAAFGRSPDLESAEPNSTVSTDASRAVAFAAVQRAQAVLTFADKGDERLFDELRLIVEAVGPQFDSPARSAQA